jgi:hypothetical protein
MTRGILLKRASLEGAELPEIHSQSREALTRYLLKFFSLLSCCPRRSKMQAELKNNFGAALKVLLSYNSTLCNPEGIQGIFNIKYTAHVPRMNYQKTGREADLWLVSPTREQTAARRFIQKRYTVCPGAHKRLV